MKWTELVKGAARVTPNYRDTQVSHIQHLDVNYQEGVKTITFTATIRSATHPHAYNLIVTFLKVERTDGLTEEEMFEGYLPKPNLSTHDIQVRCGCPSYRFRFDGPDRANRVATGSRFGSYHRKTDRKPNNPMGIPGVCYHLIEFVEYLQSSGFIH